MRDEDLQPRSTIYTQPWLLPQVQVGMCQDPPGAPISRVEPWRPLVSHREAQTGENSPKPESHPGSARQKLATGFITYGDSHLKAPTARLRKRCLLPGIRATDPAIPARRLLCRPSRSNTAADTNTPFPSPAAALSISPLPRVATAVVRSLRTHPLIAFYELQGSLCSRGRQRGGCQRGLRGAWQGSDCTQRPTRTESQPTAECKIHFQDHSVSLSTGEGKQTNKQHHKKARYMLISPTSTPPKGTLGQTAMQKFCTCPVPVFLDYMHNKELSILQTQWVQYCIFFTSAKLVRKICFVETCDSLERRLLYEIMCFDNVELFQLGELWCFVLKLQSHHPQ